MEKIFDRYKTQIADNKFSEKVMNDVIAMSPPSKAMYRAPTVIATIAATVVIVALTLTMGLSTMNEKYEKCIDYIAWNSR